MISAHQLTVAHRNLMDPHNTRGRVLGVAPLPSYRPVVNRAAPVPTSKAQAGGLRAYIGSATAFKRPRFL